MRLLPLFHRRFDDQPDQRADDPFDPEPSHERLRSGAIEAARDLARRHGDDLVGRPLEYSRTASAIAARRLQALGVARAERLEEAQAALAAASDGREVATMRFDEAVEAAADAGVDHPAAPVLLRRHLEVAGLSLMGSVGAADVARAVVRAAGASSAAGTSVAALVAMCLVVCVIRAAPPLSATLAHARAAYALQAMQRAFADEVEARAAWVGLQARVSALAHGEAYFADELVALHHDAATRALPPAALAGGGHLVAGRAEVVLPAWAHDNAWGEAHHDAGWAR